MPLRTAGAALLLTLLSLTASAAPPEERQGGILYGPGVSFLLKAPEGWELDPESGKGQGLAAVAYPKGSGWSDSQVVLYVNIADKDPATLDAFIADELARFRQENGKDLKIETGKAIPVQDAKKSAEVRRLSGDKFGNFESVAYLAEEKAYVMIVLSSRDRALYEKSQGAFERLVGSYQYLTANVSTPEKR